METILCDSREKARAIVKILAEFDRHGIKHVSTKLLVGDYQNLDNPRLVIDRKQNLSELCLNVCQQHKRFVAELERAAQYGTLRIGSIQGCKFRLWPSAASGYTRS